MEKCWNQLVSEVSQLDVEEPSLTWKRKIPKRFDEFAWHHYYDTQKSFYRRTYFEAYDSVNQGIKKRLQQKDFHIYRNIQNIHCEKSVPIRSFFWSVFSHIWTEYGDLRSKYPHPVRIREIWTRKNSVFGNFSHSNILNAINGKDSSQQLKVVCDLKMVWTLPNYRSSWSSLIIYFKISPIIQLTD